MLNRRIRQFNGYDQMVWLRNYWYIKKFYRYDRNTVIEWLLWFWFKFYSNHIAFHATKLGAHSSDIGALASVFETSATEMELNPHQNIFLRCKGWVNIFHHHYVVRLARISQTFFLHVYLSFIAFRQVFRVTSRILTELLYECSNWSSCFWLALCGGP